MRRQFTLTGEDDRFLKGNNFNWETVTEGRIKRIVIHNFPVPAGYNVNEVDLNVRIEPTYPDTQLDMVYFFPKLSRLDGKPIRAIADDQFDGKTWQRWSRHRTGQNPWRPGIDNLETHLILVSEWLKSELKK
tara:strand:- start:184 stop:579 length:396 start_codon:yes stop_codon:yes gene_type:complete